MIRQNLERAFIALGANLGNPLKQIDRAVLSLDEHVNVSCLAMSPVYSSVPHGGIQQPDYLNAMLEIETDLSPERLLTIMQGIEQDNGRERSTRWGARTLDLDLIIYGDRCLSSDLLTVPHPRAHEREFVIKPLYDLDNQLVLIGHGSVSELIKNLPLENLTEIRSGITYHH